MLSAFLLTLVVTDTAGADLLGILLRARYAMVLEDRERAQELVDQALRLDPGSADAAFLDIELNLGRGRWRVEGDPEREKALDRKLLGYLETFPGDYRFPRLIGVSMFRGGFWRQKTDAQPALYYLERAISIMESRVDVPAEELAETYYYLGRGFDAEKRDFDAAHAFAKAHKLNPDMDWVLYYAGEACENAHQLHSALRFYREFQARNLRGLQTSRPTMRIHIAFLETLVEPAGDQLGGLNAYAADAGYAPSLVLDWCIRLYQVGRTEAAMALLERVDERHRGSLYYRLWFRIRMEEHAYAEVHKRARRLLARERPAETRRVLAGFGIQAALLSGAYGKAAALARAHGDDSEMARQMTLLGAVAAFLGKKDGAPWQNLSVHRQTDPAVAELADAVDRFGLEAAMTGQILRLFQNWEDWEGAFAFLKKRWRGEPLPDNLNEILAETHALGGDPRLAFDLYEGLVAAHPDRADLANNYAYFLAESNRELDKAMVLAKRALRAEPTNGAYLDTMGWICFKLGDLPQAEHFLLRAMGDRRDDPEKLEHYGDVLHAMGRHLEARRFWSSAMGEGPRNYFAILQKLDPPVVSAP